VSVAGLPPASHGRSGAAPARAVDPEDMQIAVRLVRSIRSPYHQGSRTVSRNPIVSSAGT
jgi:hypothetical protein